ncbi:aldehyde dehydrogenase family protein [Lentibacillus cibarius]|uniref:Aldehyde dehydrogenase family protein n=1 Tax=Lentibacillus cibarius TaxID=2583219 RepID=A0A549YEV0_9BACI|nr:aldehyde dehydrogenase family protein [Lentibacillus cibarius]TMN21521.1 aldehyde dehydrogenase family protein [Lentibacillus cibarius]TRM10420.1 aldehyde dehydrogenase family protein [Lentibacillus cibarius]
MMQLSMYIDGKWKNTNESERRLISNPANGEVIAEAIEGTVDDAKEAIRSAKRAFQNGEGSWPRMAPAERADYLYKVAAKLEENHDELARLETLDNGKTHTEAGFDVTEAADCFRYYAGLIRAPEGQAADAPESIHTTVVHEPVGVCGLIVPWNFPLLMSVWKIAPALAAGNTIILKPSEVTPVTAVKMFDIFNEVGFPDGAVNLLLGHGAIVGNELATSRDVDKISFTGGTETGRAIMKSAAGNLKKISLELGGKSPNIVFSDANLDTAVDHALFGIYFGAGQVCSSGSRILVEESIHDAFVERFAERAKKITVGPGNDPASEMGPLVSEDHMNKVLSYITKGKEEGAKLVCGGNRIETDALKDGYFVEPTAFTDTTEEMSIVQEEIFGPVAVFQTFKDEQDAIRVANNTDYGLAGSVFTQDNAKAMRVIKKVRAGITWINTYHTNFNDFPWGGYKQSGIGRGLGKHGLEEFQEVKQININLQPEPTGWFSE